MDLRKLKTLIDLISESNITELEITEDDSKVRIAKAAPVQEQAFPQNYIVSAPPVAAAPVAAAPVTAEQAPAAAAAPAAKGTTITSPMVGTFYLAPSPTSEPFVTVGKSVQPGDTLCIIEAMKILNEIEAEQAGTITQVLVENGEIVEYGQPLFVIE